jgi:hypothetical protein
VAVERPIGAARRREQVRFSHVVATRDHRSLVVSRVRNLLTRAGLQKLPLPTATARQKLRATRT